MKHIVLAAAILAAYGYAYTLTASDNVDARLHTVRKAFVVPVDELGDDKGVATCLADHLKTLTPVEAVVSKDAADVVFAVSASLGKRPTARLIARLSDGNVLWDGDARVSFWKGGAAGLNLGGRDVTCEMADALIENLRDAMRKSRDKK